MIGVAVVVELGARAGLLSSMSSTELAAMDASIARALAGASGTATAKAEPLPTVDLTSIG